MPSYRALADLLDEHSPWPGLDRLAGAQAAVFHYLLGNADAHAKNISLLHVSEDVRLAPLYDVVSTAVYPELSTELALSIGDELNPDTITQMHWADLAGDFGLNVGGFERVRRELLDRVGVEAPRLHDEALAEGWFHPSVDGILDVIAARAARVVYAKPARTAAQRDGERGQAVAAAVHIQLPKTASRSHCRARLRCCAGRGHRRAPVPFSRGSRDVQIPTRPFWMVNVPEAEQSEYGRFEDLTRQLLATPKPGREDG